MATVAAERAVQTLAQRIETVEEAYEFMLAYAAQGREDEGEALDPGIRAFPRQIDDALDGIAELAATASRDVGVTAFGGFADIIADDAGKVRTLAQFALARRNVGSQLIDNLNASIHLRALLTDLFLIDESLKDSAG